MKCRTFLTNAAGLGALVVLLWAPSGSQMHAADRASEMKSSEDAQSNLPESVLERIRDEERKLLREEGEKTPNGQRDGQWRFYGPKGQLIAEGTYEQGFRRNGTFAFVMHFKDVDKPLELWRHSYEVGRMTRCEKYVGGKWLTVKFAYHNRHDYRGDQWAGSCGWPQEFVFDGDRLVSTNPNGERDASARDRAKQSMHRDPKTTHIILVEYALCDTPFVNRKAIVKAERYDGRKWTTIDKSKHKGFPEN